MDGGGRARERERKDEIRDKAKRKPLAQRVDSGAYSSQHTRSSTFLLGWRHEGVSLSPSTGDVQRLEVVEVGMNVSARTWSSDSPILRLARCVRRSVGRGQTRGTCLN